jgi:hypothetical protein
MRAPSSIRLAVALALLVVSAASVFVAVRAYNRHRALALRSQLLDRLRQDMRLQPKADPIGFLANQLQARVSEKISPSELDKYVPLFNRSEMLYDVNGQVCGKTYYFLPRSADKHLFMGMWLTVRYTADGRISSVTMED